MVKPTRRNGLPAGIAPTRDLRNTRTTSPRHGMKTFIFITATHFNDTATTRLLIFFSSNNFLSNLQSFLCVYDGRKINYDDDDDDDDAAATAAVDFQWAEQALSID